MPTLLRVLRLLSIVVWVGGIVFFAFVLAPVAFRVLPMQRMAGMVVSGSLRTLDVVGLACGFVFWIATALLLRETSETHKDRYEIQIVLASLMICATGFTHISILPQMEHDRILAGNDIQLASDSNPAKIHFEKLHKSSEFLEVATLLSGLVIVILMAGESLPAKEAKIVVS